MVNPSEAMTTSENTSVAVAGKVKTYYASVKHSSSHAFGSPISLSQIFKPGAPGFFYVANWFCSLMSICMHVCVSVPKAINN